MAETCSQYHNVTFLSRIICDTLLDGLSMVELLFNMIFLRMSRCFDIERHSGRPHNPPLPGVKQFTCLESALHFRQLLAFGLRDPLGKGGGRGSNLDRKFSGPRVRVTPEH